MLSPASASAAPVLRPHSTAFAFPAAAGPPDGDYLCDAAGWTG